MAQESCPGREDEILPPYSCDIHIEGVFQRKMETEKATQRAGDRHWGRVYVVLHGTALNIHKAKSAWCKAKADQRIDPDRPPNLKKGSLLRSYSLAYADVGIAADYLK